MKKVNEAIWKELLPVSSAFTTSQVAEAADVHPHNASRDLARMAERGLITHVHRGLWAAPSHPEFSPYAVVPHLFDDEEEGYVSVLSALSLHGLINQIPQAVHVVTRRQRQKVRTPVGTYEFHVLQDQLFGGFKPHQRTSAFLLARPEKALFDTLYLSTRRGSRYRRLPEVELPPDFSIEELDSWIARIRYAPVATAVRARWEELQHRLSS